MDDIPRFLGRLMEPMTAPEEDLVVGLMPVATRDTVQSNIKSLMFDPSPADVPAFHDFNSLQIAFDYVWQEAIDQGVLICRKAPTRRSSDWAATRHITDYQASTRSERSARKATLVLNAHATPTTVVRDHRGEPPGTRRASAPGDGHRLRRQ